MLYWFGKIVVAPFFWLIFRPVIRNRDRLFSSGPVMYLCNHFSLADAVALALTPLIAFVTKITTPFTALEKLAARGLV